MPVHLGFKELASVYMEEGVTLKEAADRLNVSITVIRRQADYWGLPPKRHRLGGGPGWQEWVPTPEEIREACLEIQETWSVEETSRRARFAGRVYPARLLGR